MTPKAKACFAVAEKLRGSSFMCCVNVCLLLEIETFEQGHQPPWISENWGIDTLVILKRC